MTEKPPVPQVSEKNKKKEILDAYHEALRELQEKREAAMKPEQKAEEKRVREVVKTADALSLDGVSQSLNQLKTDLGKTLTMIMEKLEGEISRYQAVRQAVEIQEKELSEIYEIQKAAISLGALIEAENRQRQSFEEEMAQARNAWEKEKSAFETELKERREQEEKQRKREREEYEYQFRREQQAVRDKLADETGKLEKELAEKQAAAEKAITDREQAVRAREEAVESLEKRIRELEDGREQDVQKAIEETTERLQKESDTAEAQSQALFDGERNVLKGRIQALEETVKNQNAQIVQLSKQLEKAAQQVQDIAVKAVEGSSLSRLAVQMDAFSSERKRGVESKPEGK
ncbi:MAG TPA: hypothetical protein ENN17_04690 [bacterium]|nr:hypothetical protein [bacterium]